MIHGEKGAGEVVKEIAEIINEKFEALRQRLSVFL
jgi:hypothetical protein